MRSTGDCGQATVWGRLETRDNALNAVRLVLATLVLVSHALMFEGPGYSEGTSQLGAVAVAGFFAVSGFLVAGSRERLSFWPFVKRRAIRIMPGYWVMLIVTAALFAPLAAAMKGTQFDPWSATFYVGHNGFLLQKQAYIYDTLSGSPAPYGYIWNSSLWTLPYEFGAYLILGILFAWPRLRTARAGVCVVAVCAISLALIDAGPLPSIDRSVPALAGQFAAGVTLYALRERLPRSGWIAAAGAVVAGACVWLGPLALGAIAPLPIAYLVLWVGAQFRGGWSARSDVSYGMYIYAFPLQQLMATAGLGARLGTVGFAIGSVVVTAPFAWLSWRLVERPTLRARRFSLAEKSSNVAPQTAGTSHATWVYDPS